MEFLKEVPFKSKITEPGKIYLPSKLREFMEMETGQKVTLLISKDKKSLLIEFPKTQEVE